MKNISLQLRKIIIILADIVAICLSAFFAFSYINQNTVDFPTLLWVILGNIAVAVALFWVFGLYDVVFSSVGITDLIKTFSTVFLIGLGNFVFVLITKQTIVTLAALLVYLLCLLCLICFIRASKRICIVATHYLHNRQEIVRVMIVGGGAAGVALIKAMLSSEKLKIYGLQQ